VQGEVADRLYYQPSVEHSDNLGLQTALSRAVLYDSIIQHGDGDDADGLQALIERTGASVGGSPQIGIDEKVWLRVFLRVRREDLAHPHDPETAEEWAESVGRCDVFSGIAANENYDLHGPIEIHTEEYDAIIP
jgi:chitosanase